MIRCISVGIATGYGLECPGIGSRFEAISFASDQTGPETQPDSYKIGTGYFTGVKRPGRGVDNSYNLAPKLKKE